MRSRTRPIVWGQLSDYCSVMNYRWWSDVRPNDWPLVKEGIAVPRNLTDRCHAPSGCTRETSRWEMSNTNPAPFPLIDTSGYHTPAAQYVFSPDTLHAVPCRGFVWNESSGLILCTVTRRPPTSPTWLEELCVFAGEKKQFVSPNREPGLGKYHWHWENNYRVCPQNRFVISVRLRSHFCRYLPRLRLISHVPPPVPTCTFSTRTRHRPHTQSCAPPWYVRQLKVSFKERWRETRHVLFPFSLFLFFFPCIWPKILIHSSHQ